MHFTCKISPKPFRGLRLKTFSAVLAFSLLPFQKVVAQVSDDFSDGNLSTNPSWHGTAGNFIVNADLQLQLNSTAAGTSWLSTGFSASPGEAHQWEFLVKQSFAPSGANFGRIYLFSDQPDLSAPLNGYFIQFGEAGSGDAIELFRQSGTSRESVCRATSGAIAEAFEIRVKVSHSSEGLWQIFADYSGGGNYTLEASGEDITHTSSSFFGIFYTYTISNATRFYFDDFVIHTSIPPDTNPPQIFSLEVTSPTSLQLMFSEKVDLTAQDPLHYFVSPLHGHPQSVTMQSDGKTVELTFADVFENGYRGVLAIRQIRDLAGNEMSLAELSFLHFVPRPIAFRDVVFTEVYPDPSPLVDLPGEEFVEVYNRSAHPIQLDGWRLSDEVSTGRFPAYILQPGEYVILCPSSVISEYKTISTALALSNFPTLNNGEDRLLLTDSDAKSIDSVHYSGKWYKDEDKASGGWTLERIDPENFCAEESNWVASEDPAGGTPGKQNSVHASIPDRTGPKLISVVPTGPTALRVTFNEKMANTSPSAEHFKIVPSLEIRSVEVTDASLKSLTLILSQEMQPSKKYLLTATELYDCPGNKIEDAFSEAVFVLPEKAVVGDILINEILFNPRSTGVDFLEIYNRSAKTIDLKGWSVRNVESSAGRNTTPVAEGNLLLHPGEYGVFTEKVVVLKGEYVAGVESTFWEMNLPGFNDDMGSAVLLDAAGLVIDSMHYDEEMHSRFLKEEEGVSLERISLSPPGNETVNWQSASSTAGFATPGYINSNFRTYLNIGDGVVIVEPEIIQPAVSNRNFAQIKYRFDHGGYVANIKIFDQGGRIIKEIAGNRLLGTEGFFRWDGDCDNGSKARMGYYFVWFEIFDAEGLVRTYKKRVVVY